MSLARNRTPVQEVLYHRPYLRADLIPLAAYLRVAGYHDEARDVILDSVAIGFPLARLVHHGWLEPVDLPGAVEALARGERPEPLAIGAWPQEPDAVPPPIRGGAPVASAEQVRRWLDTAPSFAEWLESEGGAEDDLADWMED